MCNPFDWVSSSDVSAHCLHVLCDVLLLLYASSRQDEDAVLTIRPSNLDKFIVFKYHELLGHKNPNQIKNNNKQKGF